MRDQRRYLGVRQRGVPRRPRRREGTLEWSHCYARKGRSLLSPRREILAPLASVKCAPCEVVDLGEPRLSACATYTCKDYENTK
ncbi:hypothetical protein IEQ34_022403 [Dendrobium chrysotoxum]|uniref:Uncharacterized protein n=1 Tax=Dendrobium chrysotoxum TaxID=161865 RepID=A0AAV7FYR2_DENCH|nr:hypothetical protein IEQ34_022403 [Dendrobium chrysotoxum]